MCTGGRAAGEKEGYSAVAGGPGVLAAKKRRAGGNMLHLSKTLGVLHGWSEIIEYSIVLCNTIDLSSYSAGNL